MQSSLHTSFSIYQRLTGRTAAIRPLLCIFVLAAALVTAGCTGFHRITPPAAPADYQWVIVPEMQAGILKPTGWYTHQKNTADGKAVFISRENMKKQDFFIVGLSVNIVPNFTEQAGTDAVTYGRQLIYGMAQHRDLLNLPRTTQQQSFVAFDVMFHEQNWAGEPVARYHLALANKQTDTLYILVFEAPLSEWGKNWELISPVLENLYLDDEI